ncbi:hypothetical protein GQX74_014633 [Glossina fuscipes]|nr:hypothetical protein GQX74_014633 [Glossina fuscipes]
MSGLQAANVLAKITSNQRKRAEREFTKAEAPKLKAPIIETFEKEGSVYYSPVVSLESRLRNLERSPLFILREKLKRNCSREFREEAKLALLYDPTPERKASDRGAYDIEKEDTYKVNQTLVPSNQFKTEISNNYDWDEDDDDIFASISTQEILHHDLKIINNLLHTSKFLVNEEITQGNQRDNISGYSKSLVLRETNTASGLQEASGELGEGKNAVGVSEISIENESGEVKSKVNRDKVGMVNNQQSSLVSAGFQTADGKKIFISKKSQISVQNILREFQDNLQDTNYETKLKDTKARMSIKSMESKFGKNINSSAQIANKTGFQATFKVHQDNVGKLINPGSSLVSEERMNEATAANCQQLVQCCVAKGFYHCY